MLIFFILLLIIPCFAVRKRTSTDVDILNSRSTTCIKGVLCLFVMFHNLGLDYKGNSEIMELICEHAGGGSAGDDREKVDLEKAFAGDRGEF